MVHIKVSSAHLFRHKHAARNKSDLNRTFLLSVVLVAATAKMHRAINYCKKRSRAYINAEMSFSCIYGARQY